MGIDMMLERNVVGVDVLLAHGAGRHDGKALGREKGRWKVRKEGR